MIEQRGLKIAFAMAATLAASATLAQMSPTPQTPPQTVPAAQGAVASPTDPLVQKRSDDKAANDEYKARKSDAKAAYKEEKKAAKSNRKTEKKEASAKRNEAMKAQGATAQAPDTEGK